MNEAVDGSPWLPCGVWSFDRCFSGPKLSFQKLEVPSRPLILDSTVVLRHARNK